MTTVRGIAVCVACEGYATSPPTIGYSEHSLFGATWPFGYGERMELHRRTPISNTFGAARACGVSLLLCSQPRLVLSLADLIILAV